MKILFMSLLDCKTIYFHGLYSDLLRKFVEHGDEVVVIAPSERRNKQKEQVIREKGATIIKVKILNMQKTNIIEKGMSMLTIEHVFINAIKKNLSDMKFDLILYSTPPITFFGAVNYIRKRDGAKSYLLLKDIFPQNAVDIGMMKRSGIWKIIYKYFRNKEKKLYAISDYIGCMSQANVNYIIAHNPEVNSEIIEVCPNSMDPLDLSCSEEKRIVIRKMYGIPLNKKVFIYGGNLGKPQGIDFMLKCIHSQQKNNNIFFLVIGNGTEYGKLKNYYETYKPENMGLLERLPKEDYDVMVGACDIGLIFLDYRFTIPNFPSRLLSYLQAKIPVLACTDPNTDVGKVIMDGGFGWWCGSNDVKNFHTTVKNVLSADLKTMGEKGYQYLIDNYSTEKAYNVIVKHRMKD